MHFASAGNVEAVRMMCEAGADILSKDSGRLQTECAVDSIPTVGYTALCWAAEEGTLKCLLEFQADVNEVDNVGPDIFLFVSSMADGFDGAWLGGSTTIPAFVPPGSLCSFDIFLAQPLPCFDFTNNTTSSFI